MKTRKLNKRAKWKLCQAIWDITIQNEFISSYIQGGIAKGIPEEYFEQIAKKVLEVHPEISVDMLQPINNEDSWDNCARFFAKRKKLKNLTPQETESFLILSHVVQWVDNVLTGYRPVVIKYEKPQRMVSPPFEAYYQVGHNALNIGPNKIPDNIMRQMKKPYR